MPKPENKNKMKCPDCGVDMNHHAEKLIYKDGDMDGIPGEVEEIHTCPECGKTHTRKAS